MIVIAKLNVLAVGVKQVVEGIEQLGVRVISLQNGQQAIRSFKSERIDSVVSHWHLEDMPDGEFLKRLRGIKPYMPTIALVQADNLQQEIAARSLGVTAVIPDDSTEEYLRQVVCHVLSIDENAIERLYAVSEV